MVAASEFESIDKGLFKASVNSFVPHYVFVPFEEGDEILVKAGDKVSEGQKIVNGAEFSIHSSIPGTIEDFVTIDKEDDSKKAVKIRLGGQFSFTGKKAVESAFDKLDPNTLRYIFEDKGVVNTFSGCVNLSKQIKNLEQKNSKLLFVRLFDDDPNRIIESYLSDNYFERIKTGIQIVAKAARSQGIVLCFDREKIPQEFDVSEFTRALTENVKVVILGIDTSKYPCGFKHDLVLAAKKEFSDAGCNDLFIDAFTALCAWESIVINKPAIERYIHITGDCINAAAVMKVRIGTTYRNLAEQCGGFKRTVSSIIINGIMTGFAEKDLDKPVAKNVKTIEFLPKSQDSKQFTETCVRCGNCRNVCPVKIYPDMLYRSYVFRHFNGSLGPDFDSTSILCTQCQLCNSVCPSRLPVSQTIALLKETLDEQNKD